MRRNNDSLIDGIIDIASILPSWLSAIIAILSYFILHQYSDLTPPTVSNPQELFDFPNKQLFKTFAHFLQYILPVTFIFGISISLCQKAKWHGLPSALKSLALMLTVSCLTLVLAIFYWYPVQPIGSSKSESINKPEDREYSKQEIEFAKSNVLHDRKNSTTYEIRLKSGRSIFAQNVTAEGNAISIENETGLRVTLHKRDVMKINKISTSGN